MCVCGVGEVGQVEGVINGMGEEYGHSLYDPSREGSLVPAEVVHSFHLRRQPHRR